MFNIDIGNNSSEVNAVTRVGDRLHGRSSRHLTGEGIESIAVNVLAVLVKLGFIESGLDVEEIKNTIALL